MTIPEQLTHIYETEEWWHKERLPHEKALEYHEKGVRNGYIHVYEEGGMVVGYYERYFVGDKCVLYNLWIKEGHRRGHVFRELKKHFFNTMPKGIIYIIGEKQKLGGKYQQVKMRGKHGVDKI